MRYIVLALLSAGMLAGCLKDPPPLRTTEAVTVVESNVLPPPAEGRGEARLGPLDKVRIDVFGVEELTREIQVDASGRLSFPLVGSIDVSGLTPAQVETIVEDRLSQGYLKQPEVTVNLLESESQTVAVEGEVEQPGIYPAAGRLSLLRVLALAGGATQYAQDEQIVIFREIDGSRYAGVYDLSAMRRGQMADPAVYANDTIVVGDSPRRRAIDRAITLSPAFTSPLIFLLTRTSS